MLQTFKGEKKSPICVRDCSIRIIFIINLIWGQSPVVLIEFIPACLVRGRRTGIKALVSLSWMLTSQQENSQIQKCLQSFQLQKEQTTQLQVFVPWKLKIAIKQFWVAIISKICYKLSAVKQHLWNFGSYCTKHNELMSELGEKIWVSYFTFARIAQKH